MRVASSLFKNAGIYTLSSVLNAAIPFLLLPVLARVLPPSEYAVIGMFQASLGIIAAFTGLSAHGAVGVRFVDRDGMDFPGYVYSCIWLLLVSTSATLVAVGCLNSFFSEVSSVPPFWLLTAVLVSGCNFFIQIRMSIWLMSGSANSYGSFQVLLGAVNMGLSLFLVLVLNQGYEGRLWGQALATFVFAVLALVSLLRNGWIGFRLDLSYVKEVMAFGVPLIPHILGGFLISFADRFVINQKLGLEQAGIYLVAVQLALGMGVVAEAFNNAFVPWLFQTLKDDDEARKRSVVRGTWLYFAAALMVAGMVALLAEPLLLLVAGSRYLAAAGALSLLAFGQAFSGMYLMVTNYIFFRRNTSWLAWVTLASGSFGVTLTWLLVPVYGISGAGLSFAAAMLVRFLLTWVLAQSLYPMPWFSFWSPSAKKIPDSTGQES